MAKKKQKKKWTHYGLEFKIEAVKRVAAGETATKVAADLGISRYLLLLWRKQYPEFGASGRRPRGSPQEAVASPEEAAAKRIADLERKVGQQTVELDFLKRAFERVKDLRRKKSESGEDASIGRSK